MALTGQQMRHVMISKRTTGAASPGRLTAGRRRAGYELAICDGQAQWR
jgi:hypothetical protein